MLTPDHVGRRTIRRGVIALGVVATVMTIACWPTSRFVGVNFVVTQQRLPLWVKAMEFIDRDRNMAETSRAILGGIDGDEARAAAALAWTRANIRNVPAGFPILDDHIWHVVIRGYGQSDQQADVFTTLLAYAGVPAYWTLIGDQPEEIPISYVRIRDRWRVYDVHRGLVFRNTGGELATPEELAANHDLIRTAAAAAAVADGENYLTRFTGYRAPVAPDVMRADLQMPGRRLWYEIRRPLGMQGRAWQMRPSPAPTQAEVRP
jgi:hypothetical protein